LAAGVWLLALAGSFMLDGPVAQWVRDSGLESAVRGRGHWAAQIIKAPGNYALALAVAGALCLWHRLGWRAGSFVSLSGIPGVAQWLLKWVFGRTRPFRLPNQIPQPAPFVLQPFHGGWGGLFDQTNLAFPSGHACVAFATAASLAMLLPKWRWVFFAGAAMVAAQRVAENAHYLSDVVAGASLGVFGVHLLRRLCAGLLDNAEAKGARVRRDGH
jgi:membrane-associated phospholipid phosphatase